jgi:hypothetical protein
MIRDFLQDRLFAVIQREDMGWSARRKTLVVRLLHAMGTMGGTFSAQRAILLGEIAINFRVPSEVRRISIRIFGRMSPTVSESGRQIIQFLERPERAERLAAYKAAGAFIDRCKGNVSVARTVWPLLDQLKGALVAKWKIELDNARDRIDFSSLRDIRAALFSLEEIRAGYEELSLHLKAGQSAPQGRLDLPIT